MGCCEPNTVQKFNNRTELITKYANQPSNNNKNNVNAINNNAPYFNRRAGESSSSLPQSVDNDMIPQTTDIKIPAMKIPIDIIQTKKQLQLTIIESKYLPEGRTLMINPGGLVGSERNAQDGVTIFGVSNVESVNDFNFPEEESNIGKKHFEIKYYLAADDYKIKNLSGSGLYIKISKKTLLRNYSVFSFSNILISTKIAPDISGDYSVITLIVIEGSNNGIEVSFDSRAKQVIKLGRIKAHDIDIDFNDESVSRLQTTIFYDGNNWYICDGDGNKGSLNGTWYFAEDYSTIDEGMIFRAGSTTFISHLFTP